MKFKNEQFKILDTPVTFLAFSEGKIKPKWRKTKEKLFLKK